MSEWWKILEDKRVRHGWTVVKYHQMVNADGGPEISLDSIRKYLKGVTDKPRGDIVDRLGAPFELTEAQLRFGIGNTTRVTDIPLISANEIGTVDPANKNAREDSSVRFLSNDVGADWFGVIVPDNACAPKILKGSVAYCDPDRTPMAGDYVIARVEDSNGKLIGVCRRYQEMDGLEPERFRLVGESDDFKRYESSPERPIKVWPIVKVLTNASDIPRP